MSTVSVSGSFYQGALVHLTAVFTNSLGIVIDPAVIRFEYRVPGSATDTILIYNTDAALHKSAAGNYYVDLDASTAGKWLFRWNSTGAGQAAVESFFTVLRSKL